MIFAALDGRQILTERIIAKPYFHISSPPGSGSVVSPVISIPLELERWN
jgi:hypothetical protein